MNIEFSAKTNKDYVMINTATFKLSDGRTIIIDRDITEYTNEDGNLEMLWRGCYIWAINDDYLDEPLYLEYEEFVKLMEGAELVELYLEDDADEDYTVTDVTWCVS